MLQPWWKGDSRPIWDPENLTFPRNKQGKAGAKSYAHAMSCEKRQAVIQRRQQPEPP